MWMNFMRNYRICKLFFMRNDRLSKWILWEIIEYMQMNFSEMIEYANEFLWEMIEYMQMNFMRNDRIYANEFLRNDRICKWIFMRNDRICKWIFIPSKPKYVVPRDKPHGIVNSLVPGRCGCNLKSLIFISKKLVTRKGILWKCSKVIVTGPHWWYYPHWFR